MNRFNICDNGYRYDKAIFWSIIGLVSLLFFFVAYDSGFNFEPKFYFKCDSDICINPIADGSAKAYNVFTGKEVICSYEWCNKEYLWRGEYGYPPKQIYTIFPYVAFFMLFLGLLLNHGVHNRGIRPSVKLAIPQRLKENIKRLMTENGKDNNKK